MSSVQIDLEVDLNSEDDTGLPLSFVDEAREPSRIQEGAWLVVGSEDAMAVAKSSTSTARSCT